MPRNSITSTKRKGAGIRHLDPLSDVQAPGPLPRPSDDGHTEPTRSHDPMVDKLRRQTEELIAMADRMEGANDVA